MRLTALTDYALRLLMHVGQHPDRLCTIGEVAQRYGISEAHLMKVTHRLAQGGWIETIRGKGGGMRLARLPRDIGLGDVVRDMESDFAVVECFMTAGTCALDGRCRLAGIFEGALADFHRHLDRYTLLDLLPQPRAPQRVMLTPRRARRAA